MKILEGRTGSAWSSLGPLSLAQCVCVCVWQTMHTYLLDDWEEKLLPFTLNSFSRHLEKYLGGVLKKYLVKNSESWALALLSQTL